MCVCVRINDAVKKNFHSTSTPVMTQLQNLTHVSFEIIIFIIITITTTNLARFLRNTEKRDIPSFVCFFSFIYRMSPIFFLYFISLFLKMYIEIVVIVE